MEQVVLVIIWVVIGAGIVWVLISRRGMDKLAVICVAALDQTVRKNENKEKALVFIREQSAFADGFGETREGVSNEEIRKHLGVSRRTVVRYLDMLEREGKVEQVGDIGRGVIYRSK